MSIIDKIRSLFGLGDAGPTADDEATVRVEHDPARDDPDEDASPDAATEAAVKGVDEAGAADGSTATADGDDPATGDGADEVAAGEDASGDPTADASDEGDLQSIKGIGPAYAQRLAEAGVESVADLADADPDELAEATDIAAGRIESWVERARE